MNIVKNSVYFLFDGDELVYVGKSTNLFARIGTHVAEGFKKFDRFEFYETDDQDRMEEFFIRLLRPKYNKTVPDNNFPNMPSIKMNRDVIWLHDGVEERIPIDEYKARKINHAAV